MAEHIPPHPYRTELRQMAGHAKWQQLSRMVSEVSSLPGCIGERTAPTVVSSGLPSLDRLLRYGGVRLGTLMEWLESDDESVALASGATTFALAVATHLQSTNAFTGCRPVVLVDRDRNFYPPSVMPWLEQSARVSSVKDSSLIRGKEHLLYIIYPANEADEFWSIDQLLRCPSVAAVVGWPKNVSSTVMRRWQMAAKSSGTVGLLVRPSRARREPTWAEVRIQVEPSPALQDRCHGTASCKTYRPEMHQRSSGHWIHSRAFTLMQVGGQWDTVTAVSEPSVRCVLDLARGKEHVGFHEAMECPECQGAIRCAS
ncbi:MAG: hypothetical protein VXX91_08130 [Planctomycetota bacterium]|nr:hypothetical protein [Planctomycetota bacterium]